MTRRLFMKFISCLFLLLLHSMAVFSQQVQVEVKTGAEQAPYSYIFRNGSYAGISDSAGVFNFRNGAVEKGDVIWAEYAGIKSEEFKYKGKKNRVTLTITNSKLKEITIQSERINILDDYLKILNNNKVQYNIYLKYSSDFYVGFNDSGKKSSSSGFMEVLFTPVNGLISLNNKDCFTFLTHNYGSDTTLQEKAMRYNAFCIASSVHAISRITSKKHLHNRLKLKNMLMHRIVSEDGTTSYLILEGNERDNQTVITLDSQGKYITKIERHFIGPGYQIRAQEGLIHSISITPKHNGRNMEIEEIIMTLKLEDFGVHINTTNLRSKKPSKEESRIQLEQWHRTKESSKKDKSAH